LLVASSDMPEVLGVADRIVVMRDGAVSGIVSRAEATPERLLRLALPDAADAPALPRHRIPA
jgi:L-arabinose transport system ATP-binding protein